MTHPDELAALRVERDDALKELQRVREAHKHEVDRLRNLLTWTEKKAAEDRARADQWEQAWDLARERWVDHRCPDPTPAVREFELLKRALAEHVELLAIAEGRPGRVVLGRSLRPMPVTIGAPA